MKKIYFVLSLMLLMFSVESSAAVITINQSGTSFSPNATVVNVGDVIHWVWSGGTHNTTSAVVPAGAASWAAPLDASNPTFDYTVEVAGNYGYSCTFHTGMIGGFIANAASSVEPVTNVASTFTAGMDNSSHQLYVNMDIAHPALTTVRLLDITGKEVLTLLHEEMGMGEQQYRFDLASLSRGMYFVRMEQDNRVVTRKVMLQ